MSEAVILKNVNHRYGERTALNGVDLSISKGQIFTFLGPNGSGKSTLFRILSTFFPPTGGEASVCGFDVTGDYMKVRKKIGVVFQSPSLDAKLSVKENLEHQGHLYGLSGGVLKAKIGEMLERVGLLDRKNEMTGKLSGGLKRRTELAKGLMHSPELLLLDEPSTGLDPGARIDLWKYLKELRDTQNVTILVTTHLMDEAEESDRIAIMNEGKIVAEDTPAALKAKIGADVLLVESRNTELMAAKIREKFGIVSLAMENGRLQLEHREGSRFVKDLIEAFPGEIDSVTFRKPNLEDVFVHFTGHKFWQEKEEAEHV